MKTISFLYAVILVGLLAGCANDPVPGGPGYRPPTVLMPVQANAREGQFLPRVDDSLRRAGYEPVYRGSADMRLEIEILEGPVNVDTTLRLLDRGRVAAQGQARASGPPLVNRNRVVEDSFFQALAQFDSQLGRGRPYPW